MSQKTILVIDDSTTIRRLVDRCLTAAGFRVVAAETAEHGLQLLEEVRPDLIILDHQLPGTTGTEVCKEILKLSDVADTPVLVSSTLRNRAYAEYAELPNVVDMLPKPYSDELLKTTVENALETGTLVVKSQSQGTAVPEVMQQLGEPDISGRFASFRIREVLDFLNNSRRSGTLEIDGDGYRVFLYLQNGRIAGVSAHGIDVDQIASCLPDSLQQFAPILSLTVGGKATSELDGIVELLNRNVVDPRLLRKLLRHQAALLIWRCFGDDLKEFRFTQGAPLPSLVSQLSLDSSVVALLIEGAMRCDEAELPADESDHVYLRSTPRGQNLDRGGTAAKHLKLLAALTERRSAQQVADQLGWSSDEARRVLHAFVLVELIERHTKSDARQIVVFDADPETAGHLRANLDGGEQRYFGKVVGDQFTMDLVLKRAEPEAIVFAISNAEVYETLCELRRSPGQPLADIKWIGLFPADVDKQRILEHMSKHGVDLDATLDHPASAEDLFSVLDEVFQRQERICSETEEHATGETAVEPVVSAGTA
ncbi:MAG: response regulator [Pirellulaceae bacterium]|nr:response regulator [Pirellulaceae bacterium]